MKSGMVEQRHEETVGDIVIADRATVNPCEKRSP
jgi:hypothetical protein